MESLLVNSLNFIMDSWLFFLAESAFPIYLAGQLACCIGMYAMFSKITEKRRLAFVPGINCARLGELFDVRIAGFLVGLSQILLLPVTSLIDDFFSYGVLINNKEAIIFVLFLFLVLLLIRMTAGFFLFGRLIVVMNRSRWWLAAFALLPNLTLFFWGLNPRIRE